ncbi:MAG: hypothetical protein PHX62_06790, partial [Bacilli bacterium]|nr:hypothetical protein [Bacilli bacterium]
MLILIAYLLLSLLLKKWSWTWTMLLVIPMLLIYAEKKFRNIVAYTPFIAAILFFLSGRFLRGAYEWNWLFFLLIPITAILCGDNNKRKDKIEEDD